MIETDKKVLKTLLFYSIVVSIIIFIIELIIKNKLFTYTICYIIGTIISFTCFIITSVSVNLAISKERKGSVVLVFSYIIRLIIYGASLYLVYKFISKYAIYTCFFGFLSIRISIFIYYSIIEKKMDNNRKVDKLKINKTIINELKNHNIIKVNDLINLKKEELMDYLSEEEIKEISVSLKEYGLFFKGELEVIKEDDDSSKY